MFPCELENIIIDYVYQIKHNQKMMSICQEINSIEHDYFFDGITQNYVSRREYKNLLTYYRIDKNNRYFETDTSKEYDDKMFVSKIEMFRNEIIHISYIIINNNITNYKINEEIFGSFDIDENF